ncbi:MAG: flagellar basal body P-ring formation chaperone FlgA [Pseudomonadota bacterium]
MVHIHTPTSNVRAFPIGAILAFSVALPLGGPALGDVVVATRNIRPGEIIMTRDLALEPGLAQADMLNSVEAAVGLESRVSLYRGRPVRRSELTNPTLVRRNDIVQIVFRRGALALRSEGRALDAGGIGDRIRVMNLDSRVTVYGSVSGNNMIEMN